MEAVRAFNNELSSLYENRPPVSRAKMASVTKTAIKAIKFYKHVVQSVEKFVLKCKPEYKVPGLYVIDSIVRQSRHQFGPDKEMFGPRFTKNIVTTFQSLLKCPPDEKCRVVRVLNLWQKNSVFPMEVVQPLLDMAADPTSTDSVLAAQRAVEKVVQAHARSQGKTSNGNTEESLLAQQSDIVNTFTKLLQQTGEGSLLASGQEVQLQQLQLLQQQLVMHTEMMSSKPQQTPPVIDNNLLAQIKLLTDQVLNKTDAPATVSDQSHSDRGMEGGGGDARKLQSEPGFNRKLLDFDYGDSDDEDDRKDGGGTHPHLPGGVQKLLSDPSMMQHLHNVTSLKSGDHMHDSEAMRKHHLEQQQEQFNKEIGQSQYSSYNQDPDVIVVEDQDDRDSRDYDRDRRRSRRSRDRSRSPRRRRHSRSRSRERRRSKDRHRRSRSRDNDRERLREKDRERKKLGLPPVKDKHLSICSTTLWFGHLAKHTTEDELRSEIEKYGTTETIKMVPPRGCAFVSMTARKEAAKALDRMKGFKLNSSALRVAWAPNIGVKESAFKDQWDVELGVTYIPWSRMPADLMPLLNGATLDEDTLPEHLKGAPLQRPEEDSDMRPAMVTDNHNPPPINQPPPSFSGHNPSIPSPHQLSMMPPNMMMPPPGQLPPGVQLPPPNVGQMPGPGPMMQQGNPPQLPTNMLHPPGGPGSVPMSLPAGVSLAQVVSMPGSMPSGPPGMLNTSAPMGMNMDSPLGRPPGIPLSSAPMMMPGQQPGTPSRPGFPGHPQGSPFGLHNMRFPMRPPPQEMEEPKEWPSDDKLEEEALAEMEDEDMDHRPMDLPPSAPSPHLMSLSMMGMRMRMPGPGGPRLQMQMPGGGQMQMPGGGQMQMPGGGQMQMPGGGQMQMTGGGQMQMTGGGQMQMPGGGQMQMPGGGQMQMPGGGQMQMPGGGQMQMPGGSPRPGMMVELGQPVSSPGMALGPGGMLGRPGMMGPRMMQPGQPPVSSEAMMRQQMPQGLMSQGAMAMRLGMGGQGPRGLGPANLQLGQRLGMPGSPGMRGLGPGQGPIRIVLGQRPNLVRPGGPFGFDNPRLQLNDLQANQGDRNPMDEGPPSGPNPNNGPQGHGLLPGLAALRGGRPGLLGARPNLPVNGGFRFGPGGLNFRGPRPDFMRGPALDKPVMDGAQGGLPLPFVGAAPGDKSPEYGVGADSPEYGEGFNEKENGKAVPLDTDLRGDTDLRTDTDLRPQDTDLRNSETDLAKSRRLSRWGSGEGDNSNPANTNGPTPNTNVIPAASQDSSSAASNANQTVPDASEGASDG
ncbi:SR-related and CTD-associated factor 4-like [Littorina saxatilis]|uniref:Uncharacterized protein n=1 Tax=Littorina saxatilis TaxID=31220 RepID=A0AAN9GHW2_9CAEN